MELQHITKTYGGTRVLDVPGLVFQAGGRYAILGANGSGKSTLAKITASALPPDPGGRVIGSGSVRYMPQKSMGFHLSVERNLRLAAPKGTQHKEQLAQVLEEFDLAHLRRHDAGELSGGETARLSLARVLLQPCDTLVLDEPTASMDISAALCAEQSILQYQQRTGCTLIFITHALGQAERLGEEILFLHQGKLLERGPASQLLRCPSESETKQFLQFGVFT